MHFKNLEIRFKCDRKIMLAAVRQNGLALQFGKFSMPEGNNVNYTVDRGVVLQAIRQNHSAFSFADVSLQVDKSVVLAMFDTDIVDVTMMLRNGMSPLMLEEEVMHKAQERDAHAVERARRNLYICPNVKEESLSPKELRDLQAQVRRGTCSICRVYVFLSSCRHPLLCAGPRPPVLLLVLPYFPPRLFSPG